jgi:hypothetical protein
MDKIKKASLKKGRTLEITLTEIITVDQGTVENEVVKKCNYLAHIDLINTFEVLDHHLKDVCEMNGMTEEFHVSGFTLADGADGDGVILTGSKKLSTGKVLNLNTPLVEYYGGEYGASEELEEAITKCVAEVKEYLNGKCAVKQLEMNFDGEDENATVNIGDSEPKKRGKKKKIVIEHFAESPVNLEPAV